MRENVGTRLGEEPLFACSPSALYKNHAMQDTVSPLDLSFPGLPVPFSIDLKHA